MAKEKTPAVKAAETKYTKDALLASKKYHDQRDVLAVALEDGKEYSIAEADQKIQAFSETPVKEKINGKKEE